MSASASKLMKDRRIMKHQNDHIKFPSGNTVEFCRKKAKKLAKEKGIKLAQALDIIAELNGISGGWHNAMQQLNNTPAASSVISPKLPTHLEQLIRRIDAATPKAFDDFERVQKLIDAATPKAFDDFERVQKLIDAATPKAFDDFERVQKLIDAATPKLPDNVERTLKAVDTLIPRELREYQKTLKQFEDVVNKPLSDLRK